MWEIVSNSVGNDSRKGAVRPGHPSYVGSPRWGVDKLSLVVPTIFSQNVALLVKNSDFTYQADARAVIAEVSGVELRNSKCAS
jgi:hypothetical protein